MPLSYLSCSLLTPSILVSSSSLQLSHSECQAPSPPPEAVYLPESTCFAPRVLCVVYPLYCLSLLPCTLPLSCLVHCLTLYCLVCSKQSLYDTVRLSVLLSRWLSHTHKHTHTHTYCTRPSSVELSPSTHA
jgi:hypothetical protein